MTKVAAVKPQLRQEREERLRAKVQTLAGQLLRDAPEFLPENFSPRGFGQNGHVETEVSLAGHTASEVKSGSCS